MMAHAIFDANLDAGFTRKDRFVSDGNKVDTLPLIIYASVVSRDSVHIVLMLVAINGLYTKCTDVKFFYLNEIPKKKLWFQAGQEFGVH